MRWVALLLCLLASTAHADNMALIGVSSPGKASGCTLAAPTFGTAGAGNYTESATSGTSLGAIGGATLSGCSGSVTLSLSGSNTGGFALSSSTLPSNLTCGGSNCPATAGPFTDVSVVATYAPATNSPQSLALTLTATYQGPGDIEASLQKMFWGMRAYTNAQAAAHANAVQLLRASDSTTQNITLLSNGNLDTSTASTFCASTTCTINIWYDQTGNGINMAAGSAAPTYVSSAVNGHPCAQFTSSSSQYLTTSSAPVISNPTEVTDTIVAERLGTTAGTTLGGYLSGNNYTNMSFEAATVAQMYSSAALTMSGLADNAAHFILALFNGTSSVLAGDGTETTGTIGTIWTSPANLRLGRNVDSGSPSYFNGYICEVGIWGLGIASGTRTSLHSNESAYWGTP